MNAMLLSRTLIVFMLAAQFKMKNMGKKQSHTQPIPLPPKPVSPVLPKSRQSEIGELVIAQALEIQRLKVLIPKPSRQLT